MTAKAGRKCTVCGHRRIRDIDDALKGGQVLTVIARRFGCTKSALQRHAKAHVAATDTGPQDAPAEPEAQDVASLSIKSPADVLAVVQSQILHYDRLSYRLEREGDINGALKGRRNLVDAVERIFAKFHKIIDDQLVIDQSQRTLNLVLAGMSEDELRAFLRGEPSSKELGS